MDAVGIGVVGCGSISATYLKVMPTFDNLRVVGCADVDLARARARADEFGVPWAGSVGDLLARPDVEVVVNLTTPLAHAEVSLAAIAAGKSVYSEKPLGIDRREGRRLLEAARSRGVLLGAAPDTFLGAGLQTCRKLIDDGWIGEPVAATAFMMSHGHEGWHPNPDFFYQPGAGPMFDMGPYYVTALVALIGGVRRVGGSARATFPERLIASQPRRGERIVVRTPTHVAGTLDFVNGTIGTIVTSFDVWASSLHRTIEVHGIEGSLAVPDPNTFGGPVKLRRAGDEEWSEAPLAFGYRQNSRGLGVADLARALLTGRPPRAGAELAYHVLDVMESFYDSSREGRHVELDSACDRPAPFPLGLREGHIER